MAYEINRKKESDYRWFRFDAPRELLTQLDHTLKITDGVVRFADSPIVFMEEFSG